ncbi:hypothetical protein [Arthrobacter sunyaminii]|uniref:Uncharacterized protein n=1 Tax=Arthrobacter sunyaminii TaxID=2816859 RepID=A0A975PEU2_9MICC|nr:hypothetical protein [Arthrobacter sunyaminii]MBO0909616.1 hypothetical protein [Arthrobacter sunyaminii]QWQ36081.1 hypothetical protein KG104_16840 [Arthrobacter sunyaminii]
MSIPILEFASHTKGRNAQVRIFHDRIEWELKRSLSAGKLTAGLLTGGVSLLGTGVKHGNAFTEMIPLKRVSSVTTRRDGMMYTIVSVITTGNSIDFRVSHSEAKHVTDTLNRLIMQA